VKILHLIWTMRGGGAERQLVSLATELARRGHEVHVAFVYPGVNSDTLAAGNACTLHQLRTIVKYDPMLVPRVVWLAQRLRPEVIQTWLPQMDVIAGASARLLRIPWVMSERSSALSYPPAVLNRLRAAAGHYAHLIVPNSRAGAEYWEGQGVDRSRIEIVPNFVSISEIESAPPLDDSRIVPGDELLLYIGRLSPEKNLNTVIAALPRLCAERPRVKLVLCGEGPLGDALQAAIHTAGLDAHVVFTGFVRNVASWLKRACALVAVSLVEGHPNAVLEAAAAGVPVVVSDIPAYRAVLDDHSAMFIPVTDPSALAAAIIATLNDPMAALQRAATARAAIAALSLDAAATSYENVYSRAIEIAAGRGGNARYHVGRP
jgi:glycosyltransferase involved in cell wall biosynthesis